MDEALPKSLRFCLMKTPVPIDLIPDPYLTPTEKRPRRLWPAGYFFPRMISEVFRASKKARAGDYGAEGWVRSSQNMFRYLEGAGCVFEVEGADKIRQLAGQPFVFIANHMSTAETFLINYFIWPFSPVTFVVKKSLVEMPVFKHILIDREAIVVTRENAKEDYRVLLQDGGRSLKAGTSVIVFPQTTRGANWDREAFNSVGVKLARTAGVPVVPVALATDAWQNGRIIKDIGPIRPEKPLRFRFGSPIAVEGNGKQAHQEVVDFIESALDEWGYLAARS
jgi:1-acyl-sn-glycerol-3-phosphate acyltransferase